ncbi:MAG: universal stress protein [Planctomycetota bacterium]|nr:universal stress protein [Planctomycetota bacterium]
MARTHRCESLLLGLSDLAQDVHGGAIAGLMGTVRCDVVVLRSPDGWTPDGVERVLVPVGGRGGHDRLRARLLGSLFRAGGRTVRYVRVLALGTAPALVAKARRELERIALDEAPGRSETDVLLHVDPVAAIAVEAAEADLLVLGVQRLAHNARAFGRFTLDVARATPCPILMISRRS